MLIVESPSPRPCVAPAMNGLSSGRFANTTSLAAAKPALSASRWAMSRIVRAMRLTASMLMPVRVEATSR